MVQTHICLPTSFSFLALLGLSLPKNSHMRCTPWSVFQDGVILTISSALARGRLAHKWPQVPPTHTIIQPKDTPSRGYNSTQVPTFLRPLLPWPNSRKLGTCCGAACESVAKLAHAQPPHWSKTVTLQTISSSFDSLFRVLFIFPSRYLFAIGLSSVFSFRWNLPPT